MASTSAKSCAATRRRKAASPWRQSKRTLPVSC
jgi:hypothetical protein